MNKYTVAQIGCGARGKIHLDGWMKNADRCVLKAVCDFDQDKMKEAVRNYDPMPRCYSDAERMMDETRPDILCFFHTSEHTSEAGGARGKI